MRCNELQQRDGRRIERKGNVSRCIRVLFASALWSLAVGHASFALADQSEHGELKVGSSNSQPGTIVLQWTGKVAAPMAQQIKDAFEQRRDSATRVVLTLSSGGGSVQEGERVITVLRQIRQTHQLQTVVGHGKSCGSMCVFIYLQGQKRTAALSSTWLFHEVSRKDRATDRTVLDRASWERLVNAYYGPAGVSAEWTAKMKPFTLQSDYSQTGADLVNDRSGIIHEALGNQKPRLLAEADRPALAPDRARHPNRDRPISSTESTPVLRHAEQPRRNPEPSGECKIYVPNLGFSVSMPCPKASAAN